MTLKTSYKSLFIGDDKNIFVENYSCDLAAEEKEKGGQLFITIEIRNNPSNAKAIGEKIWSAMCRYFSTNYDEKSDKRFENSLKEINRILDELHTNDLSALIGFIDGKDLYLTQTGDAAAYLVHKNSIEVISQDLSEKGNNAFTSVAKGEIKVGDFIIFSSVSLFSYISRSDLAKILDGKAITYSLSKLNESISTKISGKAGIIGITFEKAPEPIKETAPVGEKLPHKLLAKIPKIKMPKIKMPKIKIPKIKIKTPRFLINIVHSTKNLLLSAKHGIEMTFKKISELIKKVPALTKKLSHKWLGIFVVAIPILILILVFSIKQYAKNPALISAQLSTAVIKGEDNEAVEAIKAAEVVLDEAENIRQIENPKVYVDFSIKQPNINPLGLLGLGDEIFTFEYNKLYGIDFDKIEELATFEGGETIVFVTDFENQDSLIFMTKSGKLIQYKNGSVTFVKTIDGEFYNGIAIDAWGDRVYILDPDKSQIWRYSYSPSSDVFRFANAYYIDNNLKDVVDFAVDGLIYILYKDGSIDQLYKGVKQDFSIQNKPLTEFDTPAKIYTEAELKQIFVIDSGASRIFIYDKDLETGNATYNGQIVFPTISGLRDLYVDKNTNKLYLLDAQKVYEIQL